jgi:glycosyltransferase involved in cell wall biosynthesis
MRVGLVCYGLDRPLTGIGRYSVELVRALVALPDAPDLLLLAAGGAGPLTDCGLPVVNLPGCRLLPALLTLGQAELRGLAARHRLDIVHDLTGIAPFGLGVGRARTISTVYDVIPLSFPGVSTRLDALIYRRWLPWMLPRLDTVITVSDSSRRDITRFMRVDPARIHVIPGAVSPRWQPPDADALRAARAAYSLPERYLLYVGNVEARKNLQRVIAAYATLPTDTPPLVIVGPHKWRYSAIVAAAAELGDRLIFTGYVDDAHLPAVYGGALLFLFPSLYEGFGLPVLEAMACGTPVITSTASSLPEVAGDAALLVDPTDTDAIAAAMVRLLADADLQHELRKKGLARAADFSWPQAARRTLTAYQNLDYGQILSH